MDPLQHHILATWYCRKQTNRDRMSVVLDAPKADQENVVQLEGNSLSCPYLTVTIKAVTKIYLKDKFAIVVHATGQMRSFE